MYWAIIGQVIIFSAVESPDEEREPVNNEVNKAQQTGKHHENTDQQARMHAIIHASTATTLTKKHTVRLSISIVGACLIRSVPGIMRLISRVLDSCLCLIWCLPQWCRNPETHA